jgi:hypothetical protein
MTPRLVRVLLAVVVGVAVAAVATVPAAASPRADGRPKLVLYNTLDNRAAVLDSRVGPALGFYRDGDCAANPSCFGPGIDVKASPRFVPSPRSGALTIGAAPYEIVQREHNVVLRNPARVLSAERGTISVWYRQNVDPIGYRFGVYRIVGGAYGLGEGIGLWAEAEENGRMRFAVGLRQQDFVEVYSVTDGRRGYENSAYNGKWVHLRASWDRTGIAGSTDTLRLSVNGRLVATARGSGWDSQIGTVVDIAGGNDAEIAGKFFVDELRLWNGALG